MTETIDHVWLLWFEQEREGESDTELLIGIYRTEDEARAAISRVKDQSGFSEYPRGFNIYRHSLNVDGWTSGFIRD